jgi:methionine aminopeptidase
MMSPAAATTHNVDYNAIPIKTPDQIAMMREAGKICAQILQDLTPHVQPGITTQQINDIAYDLIVNKYGADVDRLATTPASTPASQSHTTRSLSAASPARSP